MCYILHLIVFQLSLMVVQPYIVLTVKRELTTFEYTLRN